MFSTCFLIFNVWLYALFILNYRNDTEKNQYFPSFLSITLITTVHYFLANGNYPLHNTTSGK